MIIVTYKAISNTDCLIGLQLIDFALFILSIFIIAAFYPVIAIIGAPLTFIILKKFKTRSPKYFINAFSFISSSRYFGVAMSDNIYPYVWRTKCQSQ